MQVLTIDIGGSKIKVLATGQTESRRVLSGPSMTPQHMVELVKNMTEDWVSSAISIGYPGVVLDNRIVAEPRNLGLGWAGFDFEKAFGRPVKVVNDAAMQALGHYAGGRMLFLGLGTGLGTALITNGQLEPMELAHLPYRKGKSYEAYLGEAGYTRLGKKRWRRHVWAIVELFRNALQVHEVVIGGGNAKKLNNPPEGVRLGLNAAAFIGGERLWHSERERASWSPEPTPAKKRAR
jgi:predicted NBD/HSP70 family sugar kinase